MLPENITKIIIPAHVITGTDHTSVFFGHGKKSLMNRLFADVEACELLQHVGDILELQDDVRKDMSLFSQKIMEVMLVYHVVRQEHLNGENKRKKKTHKIFTTR